MSANNTSVHVGVKILLLAGVVAVIKKERRIAGMHIIPVVVLINKEQRNLWVEMLTYRAKCLE
jgi:hypothetical protein